MIAVRPSRVPLEQGTDAWHQWRDRLHTSSTAGVLMGCAPSYWDVRTWDDLRLSKAGLLPDPEANAFRDRMMSYGHQREEAVIERLAHDMGSPLVPACFESGRHGTSLDGWSDGTRWCVEVKAATKDTSRMRMVRDLPSLIETAPWVWWQMVHQSLVARPNLSTLAVDHPDGTLVRVDVYPEDMETARGSLLDVFARFDKGEQQGRFDPQWAEAARQWSEWSAVAKDSQKQLDAAKKTLVTMSLDGKGTHGCGVSVTSYKRQGNIDHDAMLGTLRVDDEWLEQHRRPGRRVYTVRRKRT